jgi:lipopolysaccharide/colanic/teichoic acid biosynthesis glycosyltransferase
LIIKRLLDFIISLIALIVLAPVIFIIWLLLLAANGGQAFFTQKRPGKNEAIFTVLKFKTMNDKKDASGNLLPDSARLTKVGKFIRSTSLDELPQFFSVLKGDMSLIGPRPLLIKYLDRYTPTQARRHEVKPGITGWAQVNGRNAISWEKKFEYDVWYVDNISFMLDLKILFLTLKKVIVREGISSEGQVTTTEFLGNN